MAQPLPTSRGHCEILFLTLFLKKKKVIKREVERERGKKEERRGKPQPEKKNRQPLVNGGFAGRQIHLRVGAPWWRILRLKVSLSRKLCGQDWASLGPTPQLLHTLSLRAGQDSNPPTPALSLSRAPSRWAFAQGSLSLPGAWRLGHQDKLYFFGSRTLLVSLFCIKKKQIKYVFVFTVYLLYSSYLGLDIFIFLRGGWGRVGKGSQKEVYQKSTQKNPQKK